MRHRKQRSKLGMMTSHRNAAMRAMVASLLKYQRITISKARAKQVRRLAEHMITLSKNDTVNNRQRAYAIVADRDMISKLFKEIAPLFKSRTSGYTRIIPLGFRKGDGAQMCYLELTERKIVEKLPKKAKKAKEGTKEHTGAPAKTGKPKVGEQTEEKPEEKKEHKEEPKAKHIPKSKPTLEEEKQREKAKSESKKIADSKQGFMKNIRGLFRKRGDF